MTVTSEQAKRLLSRNIDEILQRKGWSRYRLAKESGISEQTISNIINEAHEPRLSVVATIASTLGVTTNRLILSNREIPENCLAESA
jgi:transcriptional regulator with XRE-family HTH domain